MRFWADVGCGARPIDAHEDDDANDIAEKAAERDYDESGEPRDEYDVTVLAEDGTVTRHAVEVSYSPSFGAYKHKEAPHPNTVEQLRRRAARDGQ